MKWLKVKNAEKYSVSENGEIRNDKTGRILKQHITSCGYKSLDLGRRNPQYVHRLVAIAFIPNPNNLPQVDHINGNKTDNRVENLRWVTASENCYGFGYEKRIKNKMKKVIARKDNIEIVFKSRDEAAKYFKCHKSQIKYNHLYKKGNKKGWVLKLVEDIV